MGSQKKFDGRSHPTPRKKFLPYGDDEGFAIRDKMRDLDLEDCDPEFKNRNSQTDDPPIPVDQEDEGWLEKLYER